MGVKRGGCSVILARRRLCHSAGNPVSRLFVCFGWLLHSHSPLVVFLLSSPHPPSSSSLSPHPALPRLLLLTSLCSSSSLRLQLLRPPLEFGVWCRYFADGFGSEAEMIRVVSVREEGSSSSSSSSSSSTEEQLCPELFIRFIQSLDLRP